MSRPTEDHQLRVKICGLREAIHATAAVDAGANYLGFVFAPTRRYVAPEVVSEIVQALPPRVQTVGLFVNAGAPMICSITRTCGLDYAQLCGDESPEFCAALGVPVIKSLRVRGPEIVDEVARYAGVTAWCVLDGYLPNAYGGTGTTFDWHLAAELSNRYRIMLAGGLDSANVGFALATARPWGVDVSSGVETAGRKDVRKIATFVRAARMATPFPSSGEREVSAQR